MNKVHFSSESSEWRTPPELFNKLNAIYNFDVDICAGGTNSLCREYFSKEDDALLQIWRTKGLRYYMNPPYGRRKKDSEGNIIQ